MYIIVVLDKYCQEKNHQDNAAAARYVMVPQERRSQLRQILFPISPLISFRKLFTGSGLANTNPCAVSHPISLKNSACI